MPIHIHGMSLFLYLYYSPAYESACLSLDLFLSLNTSGYCCMKRYGFSSFFLCLPQQIVVSCMWFACEVLKNEQQMLFQVACERGIATTGLAGYVYLCAVKSQRSERGTGFSSSPGNKEAINSWLRREKESSIMRGAFGVERKPC